MDNAQDIIQFALDNLGHEVELTLINADGAYGGPHVRTRYGTVKAIANARAHMGDKRVTAFIEIENYRSERDGEVITHFTLVGTDEIIDISLA